jgi:hypothetical protein
MRFFFTKARRTKKSQLTFVTSRLRERVTLVLIQPVRSSSLETATDFRGSSSVWAKMLAR